MPWHPYGRTVRTRRPRPSEKTTLRVISGFPQRGHLTLHRLSWRGGLGTPVKEGTGLTEACALSATGSSSTHRLQMECIGIRGASQRGRTECVPPRKPPCAHLRVSPARPPHFASPLLEGRALHARKGGMTLNPMSPLFGHYPLANPSVRVTCPGLRPALPRGRTERIPPRKPPLALSPDFLLQGK